MPAVSAAHVLIADNDHGVSSLLAEVLARAGLPVRSVYDGEAARQRSRDPAVAVLVCDLDMPLRSGLDVAESLRDLADPPLVVVVSGYLDAAIHARLQALPYVRAVVGKPFDLLAFAATIRALVAERAAAAGGPSCLGSAEH